MFIYVLFKFFIMRITFIAFEFTNFDDGFKGTFSIIGFSLIL